MTRAKGWRKIATATWGWPEDPQVYGRHDFDAAPLLEAVEVLRERTGARVTPTHLAVRALALAFRENPTMNTRLARGRFLPRETVDIFVIVAAGAGDLSGVKVRRADEKSAAEIARELEERAGQARAGRGELDRAKRMMEVLPRSLLRLSLRLSAFLTSNLHLDLSGMGMPREAFGSAMVTNVGVFGVSEGWAPLSPIYRVPMLLLVGEIEEKPWAVDGEVKVHPVLPVTATIDHRWVDGFGIAGIAETIRKYLANPLAYEP
ncbi:MAG TPA: 2-oxo acid dehydrogenase subunit E2 [Actinomycetota bacterium]|nr:2-oxo acid dehydrogenase subunit E2 [Actinomycetota bacterium]